VRGPAKGEHRRVLADRDDALALHRHCLRAAERAVHGEHLPAMEDHVWIQHEYQVLSTEY